MGRQENHPLSLRQIQITDSFWKGEMELVRTEVLPYQWRALNDQIPEAAPSFCMRNFKVAGNMAAEKKKKGSDYVAPVYTFRGFEALPEDPKHPDPDKFYGFVFQDTDFSKWIEAVGYSLTQHPDPILEKTADEAIEIVCNAQAEDGYLDTYYIINGRDKSFTNLRDHHELYCMGHLIEGAVAYYEATGKDRLLKAAMRFADYVDTIFGQEEGKCKGYPGHEIAEMALVRLFETTGDEKYYRLSKFFIEERGKRPYYFDFENHPDVQLKGHEGDERYFYQQAHKPVIEQREATGHAVRAVYLYSGMADIARISGNEELLLACERLFDNITEKQMYITGGIGATHLGEAFTFDYDLPNDTAYAETCASIGMAFFARRMLEIAPKAKYADALEREAYNGILSGMALDGKSFFYVNPLEVIPENCHRDERKQHVKPVRQKWFGCACCPPNLARFISSIASYAFTENENTLWVHLYAGAGITKRVGQKQVTISVESNFPWEGRTSVTVEGAPKDFTLALHIPGWAGGNYELSGFDGRLVEEDGYLYLQKDWKEKEKLFLEFPMEVTVLEANAKVRELQGQLAVQRGPIVYCLESIDNGEALDQLYLCRNGEAMLSEIAMEGQKAAGISLPGKRRIVEETEGLYHRAKEPQYQDVQLHFIPYYMWANRGENEMRVWVNAYDQ